uniref:Major facilitator superfamily (MFS) profile domain-containing protein n=1 Tax=Timspurckia oligopyrenoides TaxID=708627 RepID=A0A7S0ZEQ5_9RHOD|mmetsp:Transcript_2415/g.4227  ORF Transcript_2415/g.4227 Transcript_2415/m.4227 type:complete len:493 (+) Transcript_2415:100-1578(+)
MRGKNKFADDSPVVREFLDSSEIPEVGMVASTPPTWSHRLIHNSMVGFGFLADAYDLFVINLVLQTLTLVYGDVWGAKYRGLIAQSALLGALVGQITFGFLADFFGRRPIFLLTSALTIFGAIFSAIIKSDDATALAIQLIIFRFLLGVGIGGEYPLAASVSQETAELDHHNSGRPESLNEASSASGSRAVLGVFCLQGIGFLLCAVVVLLLANSNCTNDFIWRFSLGFGAVPAIIAFSLRFLLMRETLDQDNRRDSSLNQSTTDRSQTFRGNLMALIGTAVSWFLLDVTFYANALLQSSISESVTLESGNLKSHALVALYTALIALPGYILSFLFAHSVGLWRLQLLGFITMSVLYGILAGFSNSIGHVIFVILYGLSFLSSNFGPNATTFVLASSVFPKNIRASCHGLSAASGKAGAFLGVLVIAAFAQKSARLAFVTCAITALFGAFITFIFVPNIDTRHTTYSQANFIEHEDIQRPSSSSRSSLPFIR